LWGPRPFWRREIEGTKSKEAEVLYPSSYVGKSISVNILAANRKHLKSGKKSKPGVLQTQKISLEAAEGRQLRKNVRLAKGKKRKGGKRDRGAWLRREMRRKRLLGRGATPIGIVNCHRGGETEGESSACSVGK